MDSLCVTSMLSSLSDVSLGRKDGTDPIPTILETWPSVWMCCTTTWRLIQRCVFAHVTSGFKSCLHGCLLHTSMFLTNQIAQLRVLDFTYTTSRAVSRRRKPPRTLILPTANTYTTWERFTVVSWKKFVLRTSTLFLASQSLSASTGSQNNADRLV